MTTTTLFNSYRSGCCIALCSVVTLIFQSQAAVAQVDFTEPWETTGSQATVDGQTFTNYAEWTFSESTATNSNARVDNVGVLNLAKGADSNSLGGVVTPSSIGVSSPFNVSVHPLTLTVEAGRGNNSGTSTTNSNVGAFIGDIGFFFHPGSAGGFHRIEKLNADLSTNAVPMPNTDIGFDPGIDGAAANTDFTELAITIFEKDNDEYTFDYSITDLVDGDVYLNSIDILKSDVGALDRAGVRFSGGAVGSDGLFRNFAITQVVPEPSSIALWCLLGAIGLGFGIWRRRGITAGRV